MSNGKTSLIEETIHLCQKMGEAARRELVWASIEKNWFGFWEGNNDQAISLLEENLRVCQEKQYPFEEAEILYRLGYIDVLIGEFQKGREFLETGLALARQLGGPDMIATQTAWLGLTVGFQGDISRGKALLEESLEIYQEVGTF